MWLSCLRSRKVSEKKAAGAHAPFTQTPASEPQPRVGSIWPYQVLRNSPGSLAIFAAIRLASSRLSSFAADRRPGLIMSNLALSRGFTVGRLRGPAIAEVAMKTALVIVLSAVVVIVGSTLTIMNKSCKSGYHAWCNPTFTVRHHIKSRPPA